MIYHII